MINKKKLIQSIDNGNEIIIQHDDKIELKKLDIKIVEGITGWNIILNNLFVENEIFPQYIPNQKGIYTLNINYNEELTYSELFLYRNDSKKEKIEFDFFKENERIFCIIKSKNSVELNKEIVLNKIPEEQQFLLNEMRKKLNNQNL